MPYDENVFGDYFFFEEFSDLFFPYFKRLIFDLFLNFGITSMISSDRNFRKPVDEKFFKNYSFPLKVKTIRDKLKVFFLFLLNLGIYFEDEELEQSGESIDDEI